MSLAVTFLNAEGHQLAARLEMPANHKPHAFAIFAHCFTCSKNLTAVTHISRTLTQMGIAVLRFDFTGLGESQGDFSETNFSTNVQDLEAAAQFLKEEYQSPKLLIGHSLGGAAVMVASTRIKSTEAIVTIGAPATPAHVQHLIQSDISTIEAEGKADVLLDGRSFTIKKQLLDDLQEAEHTQLISKIRKPILILHSPNDRTVSIDNAAKIYQQVHHPKSFISLDDADHLLSEKADSLYVGNIIATWVERYIKPEDPSTLETDLQVVTRTGQTFTTEIMAIPHHFIADEPESVGGLNLGPSPYDLLAASLGACTGMTLRMYADHKKWPLEEIVVHVNHQKVYDEDCQQCEDPSKKIDHMERVIEVKGDLDEKQRNRLLEIADKCPIHKSMQTPIKIKTTLTEIS
uniref:Bifunctional alpha/beta hydrolase/OsmC family protein n=1 Tax=Roseihalotalea indica TaxID=2867963 RepID=A0AA49JG44_9BACT|nr:bifunctional alpha/beta hydrolase/OsmC family protein [Tunicatimonas sp. TK19036]